MHLASVLVVALAALVFAHVVNRIYVHFRHLAKAEELGCKSPIRAYSKEPSGIAIAMQGVKAFRQKRFPIFLQEEFDRQWHKHGVPVGTMKLASPFFQDAFFTTDPKNIQAMLALRFKDFGLGVNRTENFAPLLGNGIFAANGRQWEHSRALLRPQFVRAQVSDLDVEEEHVKALMTVLDRHIGASRWTDLVDLQVLFFRLTLDSATEFLFGESVYSQLGEGGAIEAQAFAHAFDRSQYILSQATHLGTNYWMAHTPEFHRMVKKVHSFVDYFVQLALVQGSGEKQSDEKERYVFLQALAQDTRDPIELRSQLLNILLAGRDTTASTLGWFFYTMADVQYTPLYRRLRAIILEEFGTYTQPKDITFERIKGCRYLQWCINETLRLYPVVPMNVRTAQVDTTLPVGGGPDGRFPVYIKKGQDIGYSVYVMQRRKDLWGEDAEVFRPERWENRRPGWDYLPFNGGPRICIGQQFALTKIAYVIIRMMQRIDNIDGSRVGPVKHGLTLTNCPGDGVNVKLHFAE